ncbi:MULTISPECIES: hypothetical protein [Streptomyces]|uniref:hypothetical protein n=1 Tax=Streptomyces lycopersici TaxID=2974589 RepID=UPI0021D0D0F2|nr:hypothetical protein [Streptomyces sp. NEAU-383]
MQFMVSTGRHHGFESLEEQRLPLALDFLRVREVLPQPFRLDFEHVDGRSEHTPDFVAILPEGRRWLFDVRPRRFIGDSDALKFAATAEVAAACRWRYTVVTGWRPHVVGVLDALSAQRRDLDDPLALQGQLLRAAAEGAVSFKDLAESTMLPVVARAHALHTCSGTGGSASTWASRYRTRPQSGPAAEAGRGERGPARAVAGGRDPPQRRLLDGRGDPAPGWPGRVEGRGRRSRAPLGPLADAPP